MTGGDERRAVRLALAGLGLVAVAWTLASVSAELDTTVRARALLTAAPVLTLGAAVALGSGGLVGCVLAVVVAALAGADATELGVLGTALLLVVGLTSPDPGLRPVRRLVVVAAVGTVATAAVVVALVVVREPPAAVAVAGSLVLGLAGVVLSRRLSTGRSD